MNSGRILSRDELLKTAVKLKAEGKTLVFTNGCFDLLHPGHIRYLEKAKALGDALIVGLNSDRSVKLLKGPTRPIFPEAERAEILAALESVDYVTVFDEATPQELIASLAPHVLVKGGDWDANEIVGRKEVEAAGGRVVSIEHHAGHSTSDLVETITKNYR
ncbi:MAG: D-glycero-beta-D-manno-heptose 1-phosphate adenylyltransferase [Acidobacteria bacterium]|nr:D-glycero-beta-D-manno-heptose 1-phosphate adenylyltransferase [Acidobacteriota bacterium]